MRILLIGFGGLIGALARYGVYTFTRFLFQANFPLATLIVNASGCLIMGLMMNATNERFPREGALFSMAVTGILGAFTTFSAFGFETMELIQEGRMMAAFLNVALNLTLGFWAIILGRQLAYIWGL